MAAHHHVDHESKLITTFWDGNVADNKFIDALQNYQAEIKNNTDFSSYNELVDLSCVSGIQLSVKEIMRLAEIATKSDSDTHKTRLSLVVSSNMAFSFGVMYKGYRNLISKNSKSIEVFRKKADALLWVNMNE